MRWLPRLSLALLLVGCAREGLNRDGDAGQGQPDAGLAPPPSGPAVVFATDASYYERLGARELRRYFFLRTGELLSIGPSDGAIDGTAPIIVVARKDRALVAAYADPTTAAAAAALQPSEYLLATTGSPAAPVYLAVGGDDLAALSAGYRLAARLGVRFYLDGDLVPDTRLDRTALPHIEERGRPRFATRGILPFHDFPEGPDWWTADDYLAVVGQLSKLGMNFLGLHTYPEGAPNAEPTVWIGQPWDADADGRVTFSYPSSYYNTARGTWGYRTMSVDSYLFGMDAVFDHDPFDTSVMSGETPQPASVDDSNAVFTRTSDLLRLAFTKAHTLGVKTCVGTETPLTIPAAVADRLGVDPAAPAPEAISLLYEGIFSRAERAYPLDYFWLWTPEGWTWNTPTADQVSATLADLQLAIDSAQWVGTSFRLATSGWVVGPPGDRAAFDRILPSGSPISAIYREVGQVPIDPAFSVVTDRPKWAIPWLEDDANLTSPQIWAARALRDVRDAWVYGCSGIIGLHWRTREVGPTAAMLAEASWLREPDLQSPPATDLAALPTLQSFYRDWAAAQFGASVADDAGDLLTRIDSRVHEVATWIDGPGSLRPVTGRVCDPSTDPYAFVDDLSALRPRVKGAGNLARLEGWLATFRRLEVMNRIQCTWSDYNDALANAKAAPAGSQARMVLDNVLPLRRQLISLVAEAMAGLIATSNSPGTLGTITNWQQHVIPDLPIGPDAELEALLGGPLPADAVAGRSYSGPPRLVGLTTRSSRAAEETLKLRALFAAAPPAQLVVYARPLGTRTFSATPLRLCRGWTWEAELPAATAGEDVEYYFEGSTTDGQVLRFPPTAPDLNLTILTEPAGAPAQPPGFEIPEGPPSAFPAVPMPSVQSMSVAPDSLVADRVSAGDGEVSPDGSADGSFDAVIDGPVRALVLLKVDDTGKPTGEQWDTIFRFDPMPPGLGTPFTQGTDTWQMGVAVNGQMINWSNGEVFLEGTGPHTVRVYVANPSWDPIRPGAHFRLVAVGLDRSLGFGPIVTY